jgi:hypothetical protein
MMVRSSVRRFLGSLVLLLASQAAPAQPNAGMDLLLVSSCADSVVVSASFFTAAGVSFRLEAIDIGVQYNPALMSTAYRRSVMNHGLVGPGFEADTLELYDIDGVNPDIIHYGEYPPWANPNLSIQIPPNFRMQMCTFTFFPVTPGPGCADFVLTTGFLTGYYVTTTSVKQDYTPANSLYCVDWPVEFALFTAAQQGEAVALHWVTASETQSAGFHVLRRSVSDPSAAAWTDLGFVAGRGDSRQDVHYFFTDATMPCDGTYEYQLRQVDFDGRASLSSIARADYRRTPERFALERAFPNPVASTGSPAMIPYTVPERSRVRMTVANALGQQVDMPVDRTMDPGRYNAVWTPRGLPSGMYMVTLTCEAERSGHAWNATVPLKVVR